MGFLTLYAHCRYSEYIKNSEKGTYTFKQLHDNRQYVVGEDISSETVYLMYTIVILNVECKSRNVLAFHHPWLNNYRMTIYSQVA